MGASLSESQPSGLVGAVLGTVLGLLVVLIDRLLHGISVRAFSSATVGLLIGFLFAKLAMASGVFVGADADVQWMLSVIFYLVFGYLGMMLAMRSNRDEFALIIPYVRFRRADVQDAPVLVDTNIIIDGRLGDLCASGFVSSSVIIPRFILNEIQALADSAEPFKRERGRVALDRLGQLKQMPNVSISIHEVEAEDGETVDTRLVILARSLDARLLTNDSNLCAIARLQNVVALNLNDLSRALRPNLEPGQTLDLTLSKEGRESHQAVAYLSDGTMIVVNHGRLLMGRTVPVTIMSVVHTPAGKLYFGEPKGARESEARPRPAGASHAAAPSPSEVVTKKSA